jgi:hypothetical protein
VLKADAAPLETRAREGIKPTSDWEWTQPQAFAGPGPNGTNLSMISDATVTSVRRLEMGQSAQQRGVRLGSLLRPDASCGWDYGGPGAEPLLS